MQFFSFFLFGHNKTRNKVYDAVDRKETFFDYKNNTFSTTLCFWSKNALFKNYLFSVKIRLEKGLIIF